MISPPYLSIFTYYFSLSTSSLPFLFLHFLSIFSIFLQSLLSNSNSLYIFTTLSFNSLYVLAILSLFATFFLTIHYPFNFFSLLSQFTFQVCFACYSITTLAHSYFLSPFSVISFFLCSSFYFPLYSSLYFLTLFFQSYFWKQLKVCCTDKPLKMYKPLWNANSILKSPFIGSLKNKVFHHLLSNVHAWDIYVYTICIYQFEL